MRSALLAAVLGVLAPLAHTDERKADETAIREIKAAHWPNFYRNQDTAGLGAFLAPEFVSIAPDGAVTPRADELAWVRSNTWGPANFRYTVTRIDWFGSDLALVTGQGASDRTDGEGQPCRHTYVSSNLLRRAPGTALGWQALSSHVSGDACTA